MALFFFNNLNLKKNFLNKATVNVLLTELVLIIRTFFFFFGHSLAIQLYRFEWPIPIFYFHSVIVLDMMLQNMRHFFKESIHCTIAEKMFVF